MAMQAWMLSLYLSPLVWYGPLSTSIILVIRSPIWVFFEVRLTVSLDTR